MAVWNRNQRVIEAMPVAPVAPVKPIEVGDAVLILGMWHTYTGVVTATESTSDYVLIYHYDPVWRQFFEQPIHLRYVIPYDPARVIEPEMTKAGA